METSCNQLNGKDISYFLVIAINNNPFLDIADTTSVLCAKHEKILYNFAQDTEKIGFFVDWAKLCVITHYDFYTFIC